MAKGLLDYLGGHFVCLFDPLTPRQKTLHHERVMLVHQSKDARTLSLVVVATELYLPEQAAVDPG